jgi:hypothetical protein
MVLDMDFLFHKEPQLFHGRSLQVGEVLFPLFHLSSIMAESHIIRLMCKQTCEIMNEELLRNRSPIVFQIKLVAKYEDR